MAYSCYKCGAMPNHKMKTLDVLKLFRCDNCGTVACASHRKGILGGKCAVCGSERNTVVAMRKNVGDGKLKGKFGGGAVPASSKGGDISISAKQLKEMQKARQEGTAQGKVRVEAAEKARQNAKLSEEEKKRKAEIEESVKAVLGEGNFVKAGLANETGSVSIGKNSSFDLDGFGNADSEELEGEEKPKKEDDKILEVATEEGNIADEIAKIMKSKNFGSGAKKALAVEEIDEDEESDEELKEKKEKLFDSSKDEVKYAPKYHAIQLEDSFNVKSNQNLKLDEIIALKNQAKEDLKKSLADNFNLDINGLDLSYKVKTFIPLANMDYLLNLHAEDLEKEKISIITGVLAQKMDFETIAYAEQFAGILPQKDYIGGLYVSFAENPDYSFEEQKELNLLLLDLAQENNKTVYLGLDKCSIKYWQDIFDEYDLSEISFVYTEVIDNEEVLEFIKKNNIKILIRSDVNFKYYAEILQSYRNFCFGSAFERILENSPDDILVNSAILAKVLKNMHNVDKKLIEQLLNLSEND